MINATVAQLVGNLICNQDDAGSSPARNYFAATPGSEDDIQWSELVSNGYATKRGPNKIFPYNYYFITDKGKECAYEMRRGDGTMHTDSRDMAIHGRTGG